MNVRGRLGVRFASKKIIKPNTLHLGVMRTATEGSRQDLANYHNSLRQGKLVSFFFYLSQYISVKRNHVILGAIGAGT
jgi:hypothetical protein